MLLQLLSSGKSATNNKSEAKTYSRRQARKYARRPSHVKFSVGPDSEIG